MATQNQIDMATRTDEQLARRSLATGISDARALLPDVDEQPDPALQGPGSRWLRRNRPEGWELLLDILGVPQGRPLTPWPADASDKEWLAVCLAEARADQATVEEELAPPAAPEAGLDDDQPVKPVVRPVRRPDWRWQDYGWCQDEDLVLFFGPDGEQRPEREVRERKAKAVCHGCPVRNSCLEYALTRPERNGVWGGLTEEERERERRRRQRRSIPLTVEPADVKACAVCDEVKPADDFYREARRSDGLRSECKDCTYLLRHEPEAVAS